MGAINEYTIIKLGAIQNSTGKEHVMPALWTSDACVNI